MKTPLALVFIVLASTAAVAAIAPHNLDRWITAGDKDAFEDKTTVGTFLTSKEGATLFISCSASSRELDVTLSMRGLKPRHRIPVLVKLDEEPATKLTASMHIPNVVFLAFYGKAAPSFAVAHRIGVRVKDEQPDEDRDAFFNLPPMDAKTRQAFLSACGV